MTKLKKIPEFKNEQEERKFWEVHDSREYLDWSKAEVVRFPKLKKSTKSISLRLPADMLDKLKIQAKCFGCTVSVLYKNAFTKRANGILMID